MSKETTGKVISASKQWWFKVKTKAIRLHPLDGAEFPYIIKVAYSVDGKDYSKRKWIKAGKAVPTVGASVTVVYDENRPNKAKVM